MKTIRFFALALMVGLFASCEESGNTNETNNGNNGNEGNQTAEAADYNMQTDNAQIMWFATKGDGAHYGAFKLKAGSIKATAEAITGGSATIDVTSLSVEDQTPDEMKAKLTGHLGGEDFFNNAEFPEASLNITGSAKYEGGGENQPEGLPEAMAGFFNDSPSHTINGKFTVKGEENDLSFPATVTNNGDNIEAKALFSFDRREYGLRFMSDTENNVNPDIWIGVSFTATK